MLPRIVPGKPFRITYCLYDEKKLVRDDLHIREYSDPEHDPMIPHTFLLGPKFQLRRVWNGYYCWGRPSTAELHDELRELTLSIRKDWDQDEPSLKRQWDAGDQSAFYLHGVRPMDQTLLAMSGAMDQCAGAVGSSHDAK